MLLFLWRQEHLTGLTYQQPIEAELAHDIHKGIEFHRLHQ